MSGVLLTYFRNGSWLPMGILLYIIIRYRKKEMQHIRGISTPHSMVNVLEIGNGWCFAMNEISKSGQTSSTGRMADVESSHARWNSTWNRGTILLRVEFH